jgi:hypothetical protein
LIESVGGRHGLRSIAVASFACQGVIAWHNRSDIIAGTYPPNMFHRRLRKIGSLLGLLAILVATLAPAVSQALASHDRLGQALNTYCSADPAFTDAGTGTSSPHSPPLHWQACAYCSLLAHSPLLAGSSATLVSAPSDFPLVAVVTRDDIRAQWVFTAAQPRAPPSLS